MQNRASISSTNIVLFFLNVIKFFALFCGVLEVGDQVVPILGLLQAGKGHLGAGNVLLGVLEVVELAKTMSAKQS